MTEAVRPDWQQRRNRGVHITIRDVDCAEFDVEAMIATYARWHVTCFSFFTAGYVTTCPTRQALQRVSAWLGGRDLTGEIIAVFHHCGIKAILMIDTGQLPEAAYLARPERAARNSAGEAMRATDGDLYRACPRPSRCSPRAGPIPRTMTRASRCWWRGSPAPVARFFW